MFVADLHNDIVQRAMIGEDVGKLTKQGHTDLSRPVSYTHLTLPTKA